MSTLARMDAFLDEVPRSFARAQERERDAYEGLIYNLEPPAAGTLLERIVQFRGGNPVPALAKSENADLVRRAVRIPRYPSAEMLLDLKKVEGLTLPQATMLLHFHHPAYPILSEGAVRTLNAMGFPVVYSEALDEDGVARYEGYIAALDRLKARIPFQDVPETNVFLSRLIEGALTHSG